MLPLPPQGPGRSSNLVGGDPPQGPDDPFWDGDEEGDEDEELIADPTPKAEKDMVDSRALQNARLKNLPTNASDFRGWKNALILLLGRLDTSGQETLTKWLSHAFQVDGEQLVPVVGFLKQIPELQFKVQGCVGGCTRQSTAPRGRAIVNMVSRHFDVDRHRGALLTSQSIFEIELSGFAAKDLQKFSSRVMKTFNSTPSQDWPNKRMLGEFLFHKLRTVRRLERVVDEIKHPQKLPT